jgi:hypothetical protein
MHGIRLYSGCFQEKTSLGIREIVDCLAPGISQFYCVTHGAFLMYSSGGKSCTREQIQKLDREYDLFLLEQLGPTANDLKLFQRGFLQKFRDQSYGDWTRFYLLETRIALSTFQPWSNEVPYGCQILICCVDAACWEVFAASPALLGPSEKYICRRHAMPIRREDHVENRA